MNIEKLQANAVAKTAKFFRLAASAKTQSQVNAANAAESIALRAAMRLDAAIAAQNVTLRTAMRLDAAKAALAEGDAFRS